VIAGDLMDEARDFHRAFHDTDTLDKPLLRALSRAERTLYREVVHLSETALAISVDLDQAEVEFSLVNGEPLVIPAPLDDPLVLLHMQATIENVLVPIDILHDEAGVFPHRELVGRLIGRELFLTPHPRTFAPGTAEYEAAYDWSTITALRVTGVPNPPTLIDESSVLIAPDQAQPYLVAELVAFMASRLGLPNAASLMTEAKDQKASVAHSFVDAVGGAHWAVTVV